VYVLTLNWRTRWSWQFPTKDLMKNVSASFNDVKIKGSPIHGTSSGAFTLSSPGKSSSSSSPGSDATASCANGDCDQGTAFACRSSRREFKSDSRLVAWGMVELAYSASSSPVKSEGGGETGVCSAAFMRPSQLLMPFNSALVLEWLMNQH